MQDEQQPPSCSCFRGSPFTFSSLKLSEETCVCPENPSLYTDVFWKRLYDVQQVEDFGCSSMDSLRRSSGMLPSGPQTLSSPKMPMSIISSCQGIGMLPEENSSKKVLSDSSKATPFTEENAPTSSRLLAYTTLGSGTKGGGRIPEEVRNEDDVTLQED